MSEVDRIRERYARRTRVYQPWDPWVYMTRQELERRIISLLSRRHMLPANGRTLLDVGCGTGSFLYMFIRLGFSPEDLVGVELLEHRAAEATERLPAAVSVLTGDASRVNLPVKSFDIVFQSLMFSSVLDDSLQRALADRMWSLVSPGGGVLWYDFTWNNPRNKDVRGVPLRRVRELFPEARLTARRVTLAPPVARIAAAIHPMLYSCLSILPPLRTHVLCWLPKPHAGNDHPKPEKP